MNEKDELYSIEEDLEETMKINKRLEKEKQGLIKYLEDGIKYCKHNIEQLSLEYNIHHFEISDLKISKCVYQEILDKIKEDNYE